MQPDSEIIQHGSLVTLKYRMKVRLSNGAFEDKEQEGVLGFVYGIERQTQGLEKAIFGARKGDRLKIYIPAKELYGERDKGLIREIPKKGLIKQRIKKGEYYRQIKKGKLVSFKVLEIGDDTILVDFNPPMSGVSAFLDVEIIDVRKASEEEIAEAREAEAKRGIGCE